MRRTLAVAAAVLGCSLLLSACQPALTARAQDEAAQPGAHKPAALTPAAAKTQTLLPTAAPDVEATAAPTTSPVGDFCETVGQVEEGAMPSVLLGKDVHYRIYLPPCYVANGEARYPVLFLLHGQSFNDDQWVRLGAVETADRLILHADAPPFVMVMPREELYLEDVAQSKFGLALVDELVPYIEQTYAVCSDRSCRAAGGISRGAGWAMHIGLSKWQVFGALGAHSFPPVKNDILRLKDWLVSFPSNQRPRIYIDIGNYDRYLEPAVQYHNELIRLRVPHDFHLFDGTHNEDYWRAHVEDYLRWYAAGWLVPGE